MTINCNKFKMLALVALLPCCRSLTLNYPRKNPALWVHGRDKYHHEKQFCAVICKTEHPSGGSPTVLLNYSCTEGNKGSKSAEGDRAAQTISENTTWLMTLDGHIIQGNQTKEQWYMMLTRERDTLYLVCNHSWADGKPFYE